MPQAALRPSRSANGAWRAPHNNNQRWQREALRKQQHAAHPTTLQSRSAYLYQRNVMPYIAWASGQCLPVGGYLLAFLIQLQARALWHTGEP